MAAFDQTFKIMHLLHATIDTNMLQNNDFTSSFAFSTSFATLGVSLRGKERGSEGARSKKEKRALKATLYEG